jgi:hypothetical protein
MVLVGTTSWRVAEDGYVHPVALYTVTVPRGANPPDGI